MYKIIGSDDKEYGPASLEAVKQWIAEGRINAQTRVQVAGATEWKPAGEVPEINPWLGPPVFATPENATGLPPAMPPLPTPATQRKGLAMASFVLGVASFALCLGFLSGIPAIVCGHVARKRARDAAEKYGGAGLAAAGLGLGYLSLLYTFLIMAMLVPLSGNARKHGRSTACTSHMRQIGLALRVWGVDHGGQFPFNVSTNAGGTKELCNTGYDGFDRSAATHLACVAHELGTTAVLVCPSDPARHAGQDFEHLTPENVSYLLRTGPEVTDTNSAEMLLKCPVHGTVLRCDGNLEPGGQRRRLRL